MKLLGAYGNLFSISVQAGHYEALEVSMILSQQGTSTLIFIFTNGPLKEASCKETGLKETGTLKVIGCRGKRGRYNIRIL